MRKKKYLEVIMLRIILKKFLKVNWIFLLLNCMELIYLIKKKNLLLHIKKESLYINAGIEKAKERRKLPWMNMINICIRKTIQKFIL